MTTLYEIDFSAWLLNQIELIRRKEFEQLDITNLLEEMEDLGGSIKDSLESHITNLMLHMLKVEFQPEMVCNSWNASIANARLRIKKITRKNPSLKKYPELVLHECYEDSILEASKESGIALKFFPKKCPWTINEILGE